MLQTLLKERFGLAFHLEKKESQVYLLVVGKGGEKLKPSLPDSAAPGKGIQTVAFDQENWAQHWTLSKMTMGELAERLSICMDSSFHKVVDDTGIEGSYQVTYDCPAPRPRLPLGTGSDGTPPPNPDDAPLLTRSLDALGLKLEKRKMPIDVYVIDHVQRPTPN